MNIPIDDMNAECERKTTIARETNSRANAMQAIKEDAPVMKAWNNYKSSDEFKNTRKWALHEEHVDGSLWAAFYAGFFACAVDQINAEGHEVSGLGCDYQGSHFGASYEDARCIDGYLWDLDSCDEPGGPLRHGGEIPCPQCNSQASAPHSASQIDIAWIVSKNGLPPVHLSKIDGWSVEAVVTEPASQPDTVAVPIHQLEHWAEYWNGSANEKAMSDALEHILGEVDDLLRAAQEAK